ncbi:hypothetical protein B0H12DRAFT_711470 [Mycena haematopus]|nr:hypothetical protein B0H12DRAFT_711470 [Mycena haematopus]
MLSYMEADRTRLPQIEAQILDLERSLEALRAEKKGVQDRLHSYKYPVLTLPNEILSEILIQVLPPYPICPTLLGIFTPVSLTRICRKWREVALTTPELWRAFRLMALPLPFGLASHCRRFEAWISRSGSLPLSVNIDVGPDQILPAAYPAMFYSRARWEHLSLRVYPSSLPPFDGPMPLLRHLELELKRDGRFEFRDVPQLRIRPVSISRIILLSSSAVKTLLPLTVYSLICMSGLLSVATKSGTIQAYTRRFRHHV